MVVDRDPERAGRRRWCAPLGGLELAELFEGPSTDRVVAARQVVGHVGVQALDAQTGSADAARGPRSLVIRVDRGVAFGLVAPMQCRHLAGVDRCFSGLHPTGGLEAADVTDQ